MARLEIDYFVLDALANDIEGFDDIHRLINHPTIGWPDQHGGEIGSREITLTLNRLIGDRLVHSYQLDGATGSLVALPGAGLPAVPLADLFFGLTAQGRLVHVNWDPETGTP